MSWWLDRVYHFVHIWFDSWEHPLFEEWLREVLEKIAEETKAWVRSALVFVDEPIPSKRHTEYKALMKLSNILHEIISLIYSVGCLPPNSWVTIKWLLKVNWYNEKIVQDILDILWQETIEHLSTNPDLKFWNEDVLGFIIPEWDKTAYLHDQVFRDIYHNRYLKVLIELWRRNRDILMWIEPFSEGEASVIPWNIWRRKRVYDLAKKINPPTPIIQWYMTSPDIKHFNNSKRKIDDDKQRWIELWETSWNLPSLVRLWWIINSWDITSRFKSMWEELSQIWVSKDTKHFVCWEYLWRCVNNYAKLIEVILWYKPEILWEESFSYSQVFDWTLARNPCLIKAWDY